MLDLVDEALDQVPLPVQVGPPEADRLDAPVGGTGADSLPPEADSRITFRKASAS